MRIGVVGAGGIGGLYGGVLARAGHELRFLARGAHLNAIRDRGLEVRSADFGTFAVRVPASEDPAELGQVELVLFAVKTYDLAPAAEAARQLLAPTASLVTFQNGLDAPERVAAVVGEQHVLIGTTGLETTILEPGVVGHLTPGHYVTVSALAGPATPQVEQVAELLRSAGIKTSVVQDGRQALWEKALFLSPMAAITAVCQAPIGPIRDVPQGAALAEALVREAAAVAAAMGYDLPEATQTALGRLRGLPPTMKASMARDFERGQRTELEALIGALVRLADAQAVPVPATRTIFAILKVQEAARIPMGVSGAGG
jgi:2-dehydropantoate 2-reductase